MHLRLLSTVPPLYNSTERSYWPPSTPSWSGTSCCGYSPRRAPPPCRTARCGVIPPVTRVPHMHSNTHTHTCTHRDTHTHMHTFYRHTYIHTHTQTRTHTLPFSSSFAVLALLSSLLVFIEWLFAHYLTPPPSRSPPPFSPALTLPPPPSPLSLLLP